MKTFDMKALYFFFVITFFLQGYAQTQVQAPTADVLPIASTRRDGLEKLPRPVFGSVDGTDPREGNYQAYEKANQSEFATKAQTPARVPASAVKKPHAPQKKHPQKK